MRIGNVNIESRVALGPMAGVTDLPFRILCKEQGCGLIYTEMVSAKAILYNNKNKLRKQKNDFLRLTAESMPLKMISSDAASMFPA